MNDQVGESDTAGHRPSVKTLPWRRWGGGRRGARGGRGGARGSLLCLLFQEPRLCLLGRTEAKGPGVQALEGPEGLLQAENYLIKAAPRD